MTNVIEEGVIAFTSESQKSVTLAKFPINTYKISFMAESSNESTIAGLANLQISGTVSGKTLTINTSSPFTGNIYYYVSSIS
tara:strand:- start:733 stop:978 length:246 start_codon:yes stop_codon:yes gene_type:complete